MSGKLYIGNLSYTAAESDLRDAFSSFGNIEEVKIIEDRDTGRSRGFAFITFSSSEEAERALDMNGQDVKGRAISVSVARERSEGGRNGGGGGGGGRRFDRNNRRENRSW